jgi:hypothetical protein
LVAKMGKMLWHVNLQDDIKVRFRNRAVECANVFASKWTF